MARPLTPLGSMGAKAAEALADDVGLRERAIEQARRAFSVQSLQAHRSRRHLGRVLSLAAAAVLALGVGGYWLSHRAVPLAFNVDGKAGVAQTWLAAPNARPVVVTFSDGTVLDMASASRARVVDTTENGANISLESGSIHAQVVHTAHSAWGLVAGPFAIRVTGTRFDVKWEPASQHFALSVTEGSVVVSGSIVGSERSVRAGERLFASVAQGRLELSDAETAAANADLPPVADSAAPAETATPESSAEPALAAPEAPAKESPVLAWRQFANKGELRQAFVAAEAHGFQNACEAASAQELLLLGDAARLSGRSDRATEALLALRKRFPRDARRAAAAFALGKVAFDQQHAYGQAATWFATCMREQPSGPLAREAAGRQIEALRNAGDATGAEQAARAYLSRYPDGPHADVARALIK
jgi:transmembrane sensor